MLARPAVALAIAAFGLAAAAAPARAQNVCINDSTCHPDRACLPRWGPVRTCQIMGCNNNSNCRPARPICDRGMCQMACTSNTQCPPVRYCKIIRGMSGRGVCELRSLPPPGR